MEDSGEEEAGAAWELAEVSELEGMLGKVPGPWYYKEGPCNHTEGLARNHHRNIHLKWWGGSSQR
jgi:hypothetical protein